MPLSLHRIHKPRVFGAFCPEVVHRIVFIFQTSRLNGSTIYWLIPWSNASSETKYMQLKGSLGFIGNLEQITHIVKIAWLHAHLTWHTSHKTLNPSHYTLYITHLTLHTVHGTLRTAHCTLHTAHCTLHTSHCTLDSAQWRPDKMQ